MASTKGNKPVEATHGSSQVGRRVVADRALWSYTGLVYELKQAAVSRAIDVLRGGPMTAAAFAVRMWPDRVVDRTPGQHSKMGHSFLRRLGELNYVERVGDLWMVRRLDGRTAGGSAVHDDMNGHPNGREIANGYPIGHPVGYAVGHPVAYPVGQTNGHPVGQVNGLANGQTTQQVERQRLAWLVQQATEPMESVTSDSAFGDIRVRTFALDAAIVEACALVVLLGLSVNVYPPCGAPHMLVGLSPAESARALLLRWSQSGQPPDLPRAGAWIRVPDGFVATPGCWAPVGVPRGWMDPEDIRVRVQRQRAAAGVA